MHRGGQVDRLIGRDRARDALLDPRATHPGRGGVKHPGLTAGEGNELLERGQFARSAGVGQAIGPAARQLTAQRRRIEPGELAPIGVTQRIEQPRGSRAIGPHRVRTAAAALGKVLGPSLKNISAGHAPTSSAGTSSPSKPSSSGIPAGVTPIRAPCCQHSPWPL